MIKFMARLATLPDLIIMVMVCTLDCMLKTSATEIRMPVKVHKG